MSLEAHGAHGVTATVSTEDHDLDGERRTTTNRRREQRDHHVDRVEVDAEESYALSLSRPA